MSAHNFEDLSKIVWATNEVADANLTSGKHRMSVEKESHSSLRGQKGEK
jgi:hypothetical protein